MGLDSRYTLAPSLQEFFIDKDSGLPMSGGQVFFFEDNARGIPKEVFEISGAPPNYGYTPLPNPVILSAVGTFQDASGNDILPYYFPFDDQGNIQLYYIEVLNADGVLQFTREGFPNFTEDNVTADQDVTNFVPNGQFLLHNDIPASTANGFIVNKISQAVTIIAQGGWTFERDIGSTATDFVTFPRYGSAISTPTGNPRFAAQIQTTIAGSDTRKDLALKFPDVNTFASNTLQYNLYFEAQSTTGSDITNVQVIVRKFFGTGGTPSATTETVVTTITLAALSIQKYNIPILFGTNENKSIGTNDDDYVQIVLRLPPTGVQSALFTDFAITVNNELLNSFPTQTNAEQLDESTAGWFPTPDPDGFDLYLPAVLTPSGLTFSDADIGKIYAAMYETLPIGELDCDGTKYLTEDYSTAGIPYARLQAKWFDTTFAINYFGNGSNYMQANYTNLANTATSFRLNLTTPAAATIADVNTGFAFSPIITGIATGQVGYVDGGITVIDNAIGLRTAPTPGTTAWSTPVIRNSALTYHIFQINPSTPVTPGSYITFTTALGNFYMWFRVNGAGADPTPGGTGIRVDLLSTYTVNEVARCIQDAASGFQTSVITPVAGSSVVAGSYFTVITPTPLLTVYYVWFTKDGVGVDPQPGANEAVKIKVEVLAADTANIVTQKIVNAINKKYFATPDLRGQFLRGWDAGSGVDLEAASRIVANNVFLANELGSFQIDQLFSHLHALAPNALLSSTQTSGGAGGIAAVVAQFTAPPSSNPNIILGTTDLTGGTETRPVNAYVRWVVKY